MSRVSNACDRLAASRGQIRLALHAGMDPVNPIERSRGSGWLGRLWSRLKSGPGIRPAAQGVDDWVARSPLPAAASRVANAVAATLRPMAQHHPWRLVMASFVLGGVVAWSRPWRYAIAPAIVAAVLPRLMATLLGNVPRPTWISLAAAVLNRQRDGNRV